MLLNIINVGDCIEGNTIIDNKIQRIRITIDSISRYANKIIYRGTQENGEEATIDNSLGEVCKIIKDRNWKAFDIVRHFKGDKYRIIGIGVDTETEKEVVIYKKEDNTGNVWVRPLEMFNSKVDITKYPDCKQEYRFELVERVGGQY